MSSARQRLRPWLESMISKGEVEGLQWLNPDKTKFRITWKHRGKHDWSPDNSRIFMEWAKHTGKYTEGVDRPNYPAWKTRLRCAFNKAPDIEEVKGESKLSCHEPFKVYILKETRRPRKTMVRSSFTKGFKLSNSKDGQKLKKGGEEEEEEEGDHQGHSIDPERKEVTGPLIPSTVEDMELVEEPLSVENRCSSDPENALPVCLDDGFSADVFQIFAQGTKQQHDSAYQVNESAACGNGLRLENEQMDSNQLYHSLVGPSCLMKFEAFYCRKLVCEGVYDLQLGLRIAVSGHVTAGQSASAVNVTFIDHLLSENAQTMYLPLCESQSNSSRHQQVVNHILKRSLSEGLLLWMNDDKDILAYRLCQGAIFHSSKTETDGKPIKIPLGKDRPEFVKIFTHRNCFNADQNELADFPLRSLSAPIMYLCCGEPTDFQDIPQKALVYIRITPYKHQSLQDHLNSTDHHLANSDVLSLLDSMFATGDGSSCSGYEFDSGIDL